MKKIFILLIILSGCNKSDVIDVTATGNNNDGTVNIEYKKDNKYYSMFHIPVDSLLTIIRENDFPNKISKR